MFKVGDIVEITEESDATGMLEFKSGKGYVVQDFRVDKTGILTAQVYLCGDGNSSEGWYAASHFKLKEEAKVEEKECLFKEGQEVHCVLGGAGVVSHIYPLSAYPVEVYFANGKVREYTKDGRLYEGDINRALFFSPAVVTGATEPVFVPSLQVGTPIILTKHDVISQMIPAWVTRETEDSVIVATTDSVNRVFYKKEWNIYSVGEKINFK